MWKASTSDYWCIAINICTWNSVKSLWPWINDTTVLILQTTMHCLNFDSCRWYLIPSRGVMIGCTFALLLYSFFVSNFSLYFLNITLLFVHRIAGNTFDIYVKVEYNCVLCLWSCLRKVFYTVTYKFAIIFLILPRLCQLRGSRLLQMAVLLGFLWEIRYLCLILFCNVFWGRFKYNHALKSTSSRDVVCLGFLISP